MISFLVASKNNITELHYSYEYYDKTMRNIYYFHLIYVSVKILTAFQ